MTWRVSGAARAEIGSRSRQEDAFGLSPREGEAAPWNGQDLLAVVTDGMGGHAGGNVAATVACETFVEAFSKGAAESETPPQERLQSALEASNAAIRARAKDDPNLARMGSTLVAAWVCADGVRWVSVGDSLLLLVRRGSVRRLNADHSLGAVLDQRARRGEISADEAARSPLRNALRAALTGTPPDLVDLRGAAYPLEAGDWLILASDGIATLTFDEIGGLVDKDREATPDALAGCLIAAIVEKAEPSQDNATVLAVKVARDPACSDQPATPVRDEEPELPTVPDDGFPLDDVTTTQPFLRAFGVRNEASRLPFAFVAAGMALMFLVGWLLRAVLG